jgi:hypothetical protein
VDPVPDAPLDRKSGSAVFRTRVVYILWGFNVTVKTTLYELIKLLLSESLHCGLCQSFGIPHAGKHRPSDSEAY